MKCYQRKPQRGEMILATEIKYYHRKPQRGEMNLEDIILEDIFLFDISQ
jgi:hypothetical protein